MRSPIPEPPPPSPTCRQRHIISRFSPAACAGCNKTVYVREKVMEGGQSYHSPCFKCSKCESRLSLSSYAKAPNGLLYCTPHYNQLFKVKCSYKF